MKKLIDQISAVLAQGFADAGYDPALGRAVVSNRPDLCQYQCNGAMSGAKQYRKPPFVIAEAVVNAIGTHPMFSKLEMVRPGYINMDVSPAWLAQTLAALEADPMHGVERAESPLSIVVDYGGPNVAKPLHVGHLRSAIIGESIKRTCRYLGHQVIGDAHLGDWGLQMGQIITELHERQPELPYFDESWEGDYPAEAPFTISDLEEIYPAASKRCKVDEEYKKAAQTATVELQNGRRGYRALWRHIVDVSVADLKKNYHALNVDFDLWYGESNAQPDIPPMVERMKREGYAYLSDGALVVDVQEESDNREVPPCLILKSDGGAQYETTDLATIVQRERDFHPDRMIYLADKRQELHYLRCFRCAYKTGLVSPEKCSLEYIGFGTMNGADGRPFKTREGGVLRLEALIASVEEAVYDKVMSNGNISPGEGRDVAHKVAVAAIKYGDLSNQPAKDYVFDLDKFASFEGNTGPYIMYTMVRIKSILNKYRAAHPDAAAGTILPPESRSETELALALCRYNEAVYETYEQKAPNRLCRYVYDLTGALNQFYVEHNIMKEPDPAKQAGYIALITLVLHVLESAIDLLGFEAPERM